MNASQAWQAALGHLQMQMPKASFDTWVKGTEVVDYQDHCFTIGVQNAYARDWLESRLSSTVSQLLAGLMNAPQGVEFVVLQKQAMTIVEQDNSMDMEETEETSTPAVVESIRPSMNTSLINSRYSFDNFVVGPSNRLAHAACLAVAESPARAYNPLFLYGGVGLGKTHLLHAIGRSGHDQGLSVLYVSSEEFTNDYINSLRNNTPVAFRERYRTIDILMIDDIQFLMNKEQTQEEFFHTFNTLHSQNKQIIITSDRSPKGLVTLEERLRSRFEWGLIVDIQPPDLETRLAILRSKADRAGRHVDDDILELIARKVQSNIRELEGALNRILAYSDLMGHELNQSLVETALVDLLPQRNTIEPRDVLSVVSKVFGVDQSNLLGRDRSQSIALPRQVAMFVMREDGNVSLPQIGEAMGGRDHTTVIHACAKVAELIETDSKLRRKVLEVREQLYGSGNYAI